MGLINTALQVGRSALLTYQSALQIVGTNISNAGSPDYTRQTPGLAPISGPPLPEGMRPGAGVALTSLKRSLDESLENRVRTAIGDTESSVTRRQAMTAVENVFDPLVGAQLSERLSEFFNGMSQLQNDPSDLSTRQLTIAAGTALSDTLRQMRSSLVEAGTNLNGEIAGRVETANALAGRVAELNGAIVSAESAGSPANALRDQRDAALRGLAEIVDVRVRPQGNGSFNVYVGNESLVESGVSRGLRTTTRLDGAFARDEVVFADNGAQVAIHGGQLQGLIAARDQDAFGRLQQVDELAAGIIFEVNRVHSDGQGVSGYSELISSYAVADTEAALNSVEAGLSFQPVNGSFYVAVRDTTTGGLRSYQVQVDLDGVNDDTTLTSLIEDLNDHVPELTASLTVDNRLELTADAGQEILFGFDGQSQRADTSGLLTALGVNTLFDGTDATNIAVRDQLVDQPLLLAAASVAITGDGANAGRLANVGQSTSELLNGASIVDFYGAVAGEVGVSISIAVRDVDANSTVLDALQAQKENISGVSLDEEAIELLKFERAFQGAARYVSVVDRLAGELIALLQ
ncbi:MAG: flagellar hook-associated protein FlgK [Phycisphaerales bacterium]|nr:flagellar hook-associated protein FlgK [Phycisphaerales bacterium]